MLCSQRVWCDICTSRNEKGSNFRSVFLFLQTGFCTYRNVLFRMQPKRKSIMLARCQRMIVKTGVGIGSVICSASRRISLLMRLHFEHKHSHATMYEYEVGVCVKEELKNKMNKIEKQKQKENEKHFHIHPETNAHYPHYIHTATATATATATSHTDTRDFMTFYFHFVCVCTIFHEFHKIESENGDYTNVIYKLFCKVRHRHSQTVVRQHVSIYVHICRYVLSISPYRSLLYPVY